MTRSLKGADCMKLAHISDLHLGKKLDNFSLIENQEHILAQIIDTALSEGCDGILIAGDVYDKSIPSAEAVKLFNEFLTNLSKTPLAVYIISGTHDSSERVNYASEILKAANIHIGAVYDSKPEIITVSDGYGELDICLMPFVKPSTVKGYYPDAVIDSYTDMMRVMVYDTNTKNLLTQAFISSKSYDEDGNQVLSGDLSISFGTYDFLVYNFDTPTTLVTSENNENSILAYTQEISSAMRTRLLGNTKADTDEYGNILNEPDHLVVAREHDLVVSPHDTVVVIKTTATTIIDTYYLQIHVEGMQFASSATAVISGLSPSNRFGLNLRTDDPTASEAFDLYKSTDDNLPGENKDVLCAVFNTFGKIPDVTSNLYVTFNVIDTAGNLVTYTTSLDTVFKTEDAIERHWLLINDTFVIPDPGVKPNPGNGGFQPQVDDWEEEEGNMIL